MAKLYSSLNTDRNGRRSWGRSVGGEQVHRLGDAWVDARVQNWDHQVEVDLFDSGQCSVVVRDLHSGKANVLYAGPIAEALEPPKLVAVNQPVEVTALEVDVQQFLKESA